MILSGSDSIPAAQILSRNVFEWTAHACYFSCKLEKLMASQDWAAAWDLLSKAATGNYWAKKHGKKYAPASTTLPIDLPNSLRVGDLIEAYEAYEIQQFGNAEAKDTYSLLSEFSHPNSACLQHLFAILNNDTDYGIDLVFALREIELHRKLFP